ncbi:hypothetical protein F4777DRAFT_108755 [Nemania sp. FL0916]|nr:hypothetical protein F4777DRAFT_108755 [Nemania sp. FL0916]
MANSNKFSNPDTDACDCPRYYANCLIVKPLQGLLCVPCVCWAWAHKRHEKEEQESRIIETQPPRQADMSMLPDASKPREQWPAEWRYPRATALERAKKAENKMAAEKTGKDKLANGVLKIATAG